MKIIILCIMLFLLTACSQFSKDEQVKTLVLSNSSAHWKNIYNDGDALFENNEIHIISKQNWFFLTKNKYSDFILEGDVLMPDVKEYSNSGFIFRAQVRLNADGSGFEAYGYQAEIDPSKRKWSGGFFDQGRRLWLNPLHQLRSNPDEHFKESKTPEWSNEKINAYKHLKWNKFRIEAIGSEIKIYVNSVLTSHVVDTKDTIGYVGIQHHGSMEFAKTGDRKNTIKFKNIIITPLHINKSE